VTKIHFADVAGIVVKKHQSIIRGLNCLKQRTEGPLHRETAVTVFLVTIKVWLPFNNFHNAK